MSNRGTSLRRISVSFLSIAAILCAGVLSVGAARADDAPDISPEAAATLQHMSDAFAAVAEHAKPFVVAIYTEREIEAQPPTERFPGLREFFGEPFFHRFFGPNPEGFTQRGLGSGVVVSQDGYILTNNHVAGEADQLTVRMADGQTYGASLVGADSRSDVAVIKIDAESLPYASIGDSDGLRVGEWVVAVGSPFHLEQSVTAGIVSATGRQNMRLTDYEDFIQTDAAINPGNSGGPLVNLRGEVIGINTAIASRSGGYQGIGFAIPMNMADQIMADLITEGRVIRGWLGVMIGDLDEELAESLGLDRVEGALVSEVVPDSPARDAGIEEDDVILKFNGEAIRSVSHLRNRVAMTRPDTDADVEVSRDGNTRKFIVRLGELPDDPEQLASAVDEDEPADDPFGLGVRELTDELAVSLGTTFGSGGIVVESVARGGAASKKGLQPGDIIREVARKRVSDVADYRDRTESISSGDPVLLLVERDGRTRFFALRKP